MTNIFSKPINENLIVNKNIDNVFIRNENIIKVNDYFDKNIDLSKFKLYNLKPIAKYYKLKISGRKHEIIARIENFFIQTKNAIIIQTLWRKKLVSMFFLLKGNINIKNQCINDNDFWTLEPLNEINDIDFFSYKSLNRYYGCNFNSIIELLNQNSNPQNPYDREPINKETIKNIMKLFNIKNILFPRIDEINTNNQNFNIHTINIPEEYSNLGLCYNYFRPKTFNKNLLKNNQNKNTYIELCNRRLLSIEERIRYIFYIFDENGNYTNSTWFYNLSFNRLVGFYRTLFEIWNSRVNIIPPNEKRKISRLFEPFQSIFRGAVIYNHNDHEQSIYCMRVACITVIENLCLLSIDNEYSKIGMLHCLTAFTVVSSSARTAMPWLYESIR